VLVDKARGLPLEFQPGNITHKCTTLRLYELRQSLLDCEQSDDQVGVILAAIGRLTLKLEARRMAYARGGKRTYRLQGDKNAALEGNEGRRMNETYRLQGDKNAALEGNGGRRTSPAATAARRQQGNKNAALEGNDGRRMNETYRLQGDKNAALEGNEGRRMNETHRLQGDKNAALEGNEGSRQAPGVVANLRDLVKNTAPILEQYGYTRSGITVVAGGIYSFRLQMKIHYKLFVLGQYKDIHVAMLVANMFKIMQRKFKSVRLIKFDVWELNRPQIEATAVAAVRHELQAKQDRLEDARQLRNDLALTGVPGREHMALCAGELDKATGKKAKRKLTDSISGDGAGAGAGGAGGAGSGSTAGVPSKKMKKEAAAEWRGLMSKTFLLVAGLTDLGDFGRYLGPKQGKSKCFQRICEIG
jgi:hypothetical protein